MFEKRKNRSFWEEHEFQILVCLPAILVLLVGVLSFFFVPGIVESIPDNPRPALTVRVEVPEQEFWSVESIRWSISGYKFATEYDPGTIPLKEGSLACAESNIFFDYRSDMHEARALERYPRFLMEPLFKCVPVEHLTISGDAFNIHARLAESGIDPHYLTNFSYTLSFVSTLGNHVSDSESMLISESYTNAEINFLEQCMAVRQDFPLVIRNGRIGRYYGDLCN